MDERFAPGARVRVTQPDVDVHTRAPRYARGRVGRVLESRGTHPLPDAVVAGERPPREQTVWAVSFDARELFGAGDHVVVLELWEAYLEAAGGEQR